MGICVMLPWHRSLCVLQASLKHTLSEFWVQLQGCGKVGRQAQVSWGCSASSQCCLLGYSLGAARARACYLGIMGCVPCFAKTRLPFPQSTELS